MGRFSVEQILVSRGARDISGRYVVRALVKGFNRNPALWGTLFQADLLFRAVGKRRDSKGMAVGIIEKDTPVYLLGEAPLLPGDYILSCPGLTRQTTRFRLQAEACAPVRTYCRDRTVRPSHIDRITLYSSSGAIAGFVSTLKIQACCREFFLKDAPTIPNDYGLSVILPLDRPYRTIVDGRSVTAKPGEYQVVDPLAFDAPHPRTPFPIHVRRIGMQQTMLRALRTAVGLGHAMGPFGFDPSPRPITPAIAAAITRLDKTLARNGEIGAAHSAMTALEQLLLVLLNTHPNALRERWSQKPPPKPLDPRLEAAAGYLKTHAAAPYSATTVARHAHISPQSLRSLFKRHFGKTPNRFLQEIRVEKAKELLKNPAMKIRTVAAAVGYTDVRGFRRVFLRHARRQAQTFRPA